MGNDLKTFWRNLIAGVSGIARITAFDVSTYDCKIAGEVRNYDPAAVFSPIPRTCAAATVTRS